MRRTKTLQDSITYLAREAQFAQTREEHENYSIALRLLGLLYDGWNPTPSLFDVACGYVVGLASAKYVHRKARRAAHERRELLRAIPDYDYSTEPLSDDDPTDGRRHNYGKQLPRTGVSKHAAIAAYSTVRSGEFTSRTTDPPKRVNSPAQLKRITRMIEDAAYFGA